jgi:hypothetical protein
MVVLPVHDQSSGTYSENYLEIYIGGYLYTTDTALGPGTPDEYMSFEQ